MTNSMTNAELLYINDSDLLLLPEKGAMGAVSELALQAKRSQRPLPFHLYNQPAVAHIIKKAVNEPHRAKSARHSGDHRPKHLQLALLSNEHYLTKSWLRYLREELLNATPPMIATELEISLTTWRRWESPSPTLPNPLWLDLLHRWYLAALPLRGPGPKPPWILITTPSERIALRKLWRPSYYHKKSLERATIYNDTETGFRPGP